MPIVMPGPSRRQSDSRRTHCYTAGRCTDCDVPLNNPEDWLCARCRAYLRLAVELHEFSKEAGP
jgi:hypothetical protein